MDAQTDAQGEAGVAAGGDASEPLIRTEDLHKRFGALEVLTGFNLTVDRGEVLVLIGPSGSGKSTALRCITRLVEPTSGRIWFEGRDITGKDVNINAVRRELVMVFQAYNLFPHLSTRRNITLPLREVVGLGRREANARAEEVLEKVGLSDKADAYPGQLSGGQQQRVAIARALAMRPKAILFDEPTSSLDPELTGEVLRVMRDLAEEGMTMIVVTHEMGFARDVADEVAFLDGGVVVEEGPPAQLLERPEHERTREFLSRILRD